CTCSPLAPPPLLLGREERPGLEVSELALVELVLAPEPAELLAGLRQSLDEDLTIGHDPLLGGGKTKRASALSVAGLAFVPLAPSHSALPPDPGVRPIALCSPCTKGRARVSSDGVAGRAPRTAGLTRRGDGAPWPLRDPRRGPR